MNIVFVTQNDSFYLPTTMEFLIKNIPHECNLVGVVVLSPSPFGKKLSFAGKLVQTFSVFGLRFGVYYGLKLIWTKIFGKDVVSVLKTHGLTPTYLDGNINSEQSLEVIRKLKPELMISVQANEIFKSDLLQIAPLGTLNLHTSLLPKYRGLMPTFWVLKNGERTTGVSVFFVDEGIDSGPILVQREVNIGNKSQAQLIKDTKALGAECIIEAITKVRDGSLKLKENKDSDMSYFQFPTKDDVAQFRTSGARFF